MFFIKSFVTTVTFLIRVLINILSKAIISVLPSTMILLFTFQPYMAGMMFSPQFTSDK